jgi:delta1-piperideine-2-carboxylate reductase
MQPQTISVDALLDLVTRVLLRHGVSPSNAAPVAETIVAAERDGSASHGLLRLPGYVATLNSGWVDGCGVPIVTDAAPGLVLVEAGNGFAQPALRASAPLLRQKARSQGITAVAIRNSHHFAAVWPDIEPFAADGFIALALVNGRRRMVVYDGKRKVLGTSPMGFACPRVGKPPLVWDQASSVMAQGDVLLAAQRGEMLPEGVGLDADGNPTTDPRVLLDGGGSALPFGGHKGSSIALMIEVMAGALTGGCFGFEDRSAEFPGAQTSKAGQTVILIDPSRVPGNRYLERIESLFTALGDSGVTRLPADRRYARRERSLRDGIVLSDRQRAQLDELLA